MTLSEIENEFRAVSSLCMNNISHSIHTNIVEVLWHGELPDSPYFFLDMEMCGMNLESYIRSEVTRFAYLAQVLEMCSTLTSC
jgi:hypothetical protein